MKQGPTLLCVGPCLKQNGHRGRHDTYTKCTISVCPQKPYSQRFFCTSGAPCRKRGCRSVSRCCSCTTNIGNLRSPSRFQPHILPHNAATNPRESALLDSGLRKRRTCSLQLGCICRPLKNKDNGLILYVVFFSFFLFSFFLLSVSLSLFPIPPPPPSSSSPPSPPFFLFFFFLSPFCCCRSFILFYCFV